MANAPSSISTVVILIHGIRTAARWQNRVAALLEQETAARVIPLKYGYFDTLRFLCPFRLCRNDPIERLRKQIDGINSQYPGKRLVIFAHSFGTYALSRILMENPHLQFDRIVLCGSIIPQDYDWSRVDNQIRAAEKRSAIINDCGTRDVWPVMARSVTWGYGASGTYGFGSFNVTDRFHPLAHSDFFDDGFVRKYWVPAARGDAVAFSPGDRAEIKSPGWFEVLRLPFRWLMPLAAAAAAGLAAVSFVPSFIGCGANEVVFDGRCMSTAGFKSREQLSEKIQTLYSEVSKTLDIKGGSLFPAMDDYVANPTPEGWQAVRSSATTLLDHLAVSLNDITETDAQIRRDNSEGKVYFIANGVKIQVDDEFYQALTETRAQFMGRQTIANEMRGAGDLPPVGKVSAWRQDLQVLHDRLSRTLDGLLRLLPEA